MKINVSNMSPRIWNSIVQSVTAQTNEKFQDLKIHLDWPQNSAWLLKKQQVPFCVASTGFLNIQNPKGLHVCHHHPRKKPGSLISRDLKLTLEQAAKHITSPAETVNGN